MTINPRIKPAVEYLKEYINMYENQACYEEHSDSILIDDIIYGLGVALDSERYKNADGYDRFKREVVIPHLLGRTPEPSVRKTIPYHYKY